jgi:SIR2-like domain
LAEAAGYPADDSHEKALSDLLVAIKQLAADIPDDKAQIALTPVVRAHLASVLNLAQIASWAQHVAGTREAVNFELRKAFAVNSPPGDLHITLASVKDAKLYVTTNYDDLLEQALAPRKPHLIVDRGEKGLWVGASGTKLQPVSPTGNALYELLDDPQTQSPSAPIIFKMHGSVDKIDAKNDSYLISEEDYVDFLGRSGGSYIPPYIMGLMTGKAFLFLGYSLEDWNVRVILRKLLKSSKSGDVRWWAIVRGRSERELERWKANDLNVYAMDLSEFAKKLKGRL